MKTFVFWEELMGVKEKKNTHYTETRTQKMGVLRGDFHVNSKSIEIR